MIECVALLIVGGAAGVLNGRIVDICRPGRGAGEQARAASASPDVIILMLALMLERAAFIFFTPVFVELPS